MKNLKLKETSISGIYKITCLTNGKFYIGSSKCIYHRVKRHLSELRNNRHANSIIQNVFNKYGEETFFTSILEKVDIEQNPQLLIEKEVFWIKELSPYMNINAPVLISLSTTQKQQISDSLKEYFRNHTQKGRQISIFDLEDNLLGHFENWTQAAKYCNVITSTLRKIVDKNLRYKNFLVRSGHVYNNSIPYLGKSQIKINSKYLTIPLVENMKKGPGRSVIILQYDKNGNFLNWFENTKEASFKTNVKVSMINNSLFCGARGGGYYWKKYKKN